MTGDIRVVIAEDNEMLRLSLAALFDVSPGLQVVGMAENGRQAIELCGQLHPDIILMDMLMPVMDGLAATRVIVQSYPDTQIIVLTTGFGWVAQDALEAGASEYLLKTDSGDQIVAAIIAVHAKKATLH
jgi:DNA-binding NarL/FixJ family response regulator